MWIDIRMDKKNLHQKIEYLKDQVNKTIMKDQRITDEEEKMIESIFSNLSAFEKSVEKLTNEGKISEYDGKELERLLQNMEDETLRIAGFDTEISKDEHAILRVLSENLRAIKSEFKDETGSDLPPLPK